MKFKRLFLIHLIIILILVMLIVKIRIQESDFDCDRCEVVFKNKLGFETENILESDMDITLVSLYHYYLQGDCLIRYDEGGGFVGGIINE